MLQLSNEKSALTLKAYAKALSFMLLHETVLKHALAAPNEKTYAQASGPYFS